MKKIKKLMVLFTLAIVFAFTQGQSISASSGTVGPGGATWTLDSNGVVTVGGGTIFNTWTAGSIQSPWHAHRDEVKKIVFTEPVTAQTELLGLFALLHNLEEIENAEYIDTNNVWNMNSMFIGTNKLTTVNVANWDTSNVTNMNQMFDGAHSLTYLDVTNWDTSKVNTMRSMFGNTRSLDGLNVTNWNTSNVTMMNYMFYNTESLTSLDVANWNTSTVIRMEYMFSGTTELTELNVSNWNTSNVTSMDGMFSGARSLIELDLSNWNVDSVTHMHWMFLRASALENLNLSGWNTSQTEFMNNMFGNTNLKVLTLGNDFVFGENSNVSNNLAGQPIHVNLPNIPTKNGFTTDFTGNWQNVGNGTIANPQGNIILTSEELMSNFNGVAMADTFVWQRDASSLIPVTFHLHGGQNQTDFPQQNIVNGMFASAPATQPTKEGYTFVGWFTHETGGGAFNFESTAITQPTTVHARWQPADEGEGAPVEDLETDDIADLPTTGTENMFIVLITVISGLIASTLYYRIKEKY